MTVDSTLPKDLLRRASRLMAEIQAINETIAGLPWTPAKHREARHTELVLQRVKKIEELRHLRTTIRTSATPSPFAA